MKNLANLLIVTILLATAIPTTAQISPIAHMNKSEPWAGLQVSADDRHASFQANAMTNLDLDIEVQMKMGITVARDGRSKFTAYPLYGTLDVKTKDFTPMAALAWQFTTDRLTTQVNADFYNENGTILWRPTLDVTYALWGRRWQGEKLDEPPMVLNRYDYLNTFDCFMLGFAFINGASNGLLEIQHADPDRFAELMGAESPYDFGGQLEWERAYEGNRYLKENGRPNKHKPEWAGNFGRTARHTFGDVSKNSARLMGVSIGLSTAWDFYTTKKKCDNDSSLNRRKELRKSIQRSALKALVGFGISMYTESRFYNLRY